jgi:hypothetical protein
MLRAEVYARALRACQSRNEVLFKAHNGLFFNTPIVMLKSAQVKG